ncbi:hypothetical protein A2U01_0073469, partial [Trifolium medium]|nr:hypothetical protein [Trifolium medium]
MADNSASGSNKPNSFSLLNTASAIVDYFAKKGHVPTIEQLIPVEEEIKYEVQARAPALKPITLALDTPTAKNNDEI